MGICSELTTLGGNLRRIDYAGWEPAQYCLRWVGTCTELTRWVGTCTELTRWVGTCIELTTLGGNLIKHQQKEQLCAGTAAQVREIGFERGMLIQKASEEGGSREISKWEVSDFDGSAKSAMYSRKLQKRELLAVVSN